MERYLYTFVGKQSKGEGKMRKLIPVSIFFSILAFPQLAFAYNDELSNAFIKNILPIFWDIGKVIFICSVVYGTYYIMRRNYNEGIERIKMASIGYVAMRMTSCFIDLIDKIADGIKF